jgi:hypothetical protein
MGKHILCEHNKRRVQCIECGGKQVCEHRRYRPCCKDCRGAGFCEHNNLRYWCRQCGGFPVLAKRMYTSAKYRAKKLGIPFNITVSDILKLINDGVCPVLGIPYDLTSSVTVVASPSLDRFIPNLGYVLGNCAVISNLANAVKNSATAEQVHRVAEWMDKFYDNSGAAVQ